MCGGREGQDPKPHGVWPISFGFAWGLSAAGAAAETCRYRPRQCRHGGRRAPGRLRTYRSGILLTDLLLKCALRTLVGRSGVSFGDGSNHFQRGNSRVARQDVGRQLPLARRAWNMCEKKYGSSVPCD